MITQKAKKKKETIYALDCRGGTYMPSSSKHILYGRRLACLQRGCIYVGRHAWSTHILYGLRLARLQRGRIYVGRHAWSTHILYGRRLACLQRGHAYTIWPSAGTLAAGPHICRLTRLERAYI